MPQETYHRCRAEIDLGIASSRDPVNAFLPDLHPRTTTIYSPWYTRTCPVCGHKFREGDRVRLCPGVEGKPCGQAYHDDAHYDLRCWPERFKGGQVCKKGGYDRFAGRDVAGCSFTWSGEPADHDGAHVVKCPCGRCETYFHDDIYRRLECWNQWNGSQGLFYCPTTGARIPPEKLRNTNPSHEPA